jgi:hypothetical protein
MIWNKHSQSLIALARHNGIKTAGELAQFLKLTNESVA